MCQTIRCKVARLLDPSPVQISKVSVGLLFERSRSGMRINRAVISVALNYVCMYVCMLSRFRNAILDFTHVHTGIITHALVGRTAWPDKSRKPE